MNKECWNSKIMCYSNSEEFQYLEEIESVIKQTNKIVKDLKDIDRAAHWRIQCDDGKNKADFSEIKTKLNEVQKLIDEL
jgi:hypothetical protein